ncbi:MAG: SMI1/KNR4 family protein [Verrucomicrobia bacterium]|nr:SMI1/KNR4 family protein [Verrucomicrobiota bacterium]
MNFKNPETLPTEDEVASIEKELGFTFPAQIRSFFLENNGADPDPYVFKSDTLNTVVSETLPLVSRTGRGTAVDVYRKLVLERAIVGTNFFPFAIDGGGDYFFVNCDGREAGVYFFNSDTDCPEDRMEKVASSLDAFWGALGPEEW